MMSDIKILFFFIFPLLYFADCASDRVVQAPVPKPAAAPVANLPSAPAVQQPAIELDPLKIFFKQREDDLERALKVIAEKKIIKNLSHLQKMDAGGKKYYLLERESITGMIRSVTKGIYADMILINQHGKIIYTMTDNDIFGKYVVQQMKNSPYERCFVNQGKPVYIDDIYNRYQLSNGYHVFFSGTSNGETGFSGVLILQVNIDEISRVIPDSAVIINPDGKYKISRDRSQIDKAYGDFSFIEHSAMKNPGHVYSFSSNTGIFSYRFFGYANISWIVISSR